MYKIPVLPTDLFNLFNLISTESNTANKKAHFDYIHNISDSTRVVP